MNTKNILIIIVVLILVITAGYKALAVNISNKEVNKIMEGKKVLIVYYSYSGNTEFIAKKIQAKTGGDLFKIETEKPYPASYNEVVEQAKQEKAEDYRPKIKSIPKNIQEYDIIFLGTPVWWYTMAPPLKTFLSQVDLKEKIVVPFCTHGGGGASSTFSDIKKLASQANIQEGLEIYSRGNNSTDKEIDLWIMQLK